MLNTIDRKQIEIDFQQNYDCPNHRVYLHCGSMVAIKCERVIVGNQCENVMVVSMLDIFFFIVIVQFSMSTQFYRLFEAQVLHHRHT